MSDKTSSNSKEQESDKKMKIEKTEKTRLENMKPFHLNVGDEDIQIPPEYLDISTTLNSNTIELLTNGPNVKGCKIVLEPQDILQLMKWLAGQYEHIRRDLIHVEKQSQKVKEEQVERGMPNMIFTDIEKKIINSLQPHQILTKSEIEKKTGLQSDQVRRGIEWLKLKNFAHVKESTDTHYHLGEKDYLGGKMIMLSETGSTTNKDKKSESKVDFLKDEKGKPLIVNSPVQIQTIPSIKEIEKNQKIVQALIEQFNALEHCQTDSFVLCRKTLNSIYNKATGFDISCT